MASSLPFLLRTTTEQTQRASKTHIESESTKSDQPTRKSRGRKPSKGPPRNKQPQRGMGVEQLERLRLQERWKEITETNQVDSLNLQPDQLSVPDPIHSFPVQYGTVSYGVPVINGGGFLGFDEGGLFFKRIENGGFGQELNRSHSSGQVLLNPYAFGAPDMRVRVGSTGTAFEISNELTSMPKGMHNLDNIPSDVCFKKKRFNGESIGYQNGSKEKFAEISPINSSDFLGLNLENKININHNNENQMGGFTARAARSAFYASHNLTDQSVQVVAVHRKANPTMGGNVFMEYDFFPGKTNGKNSAEALAVVGNAGGEASCVSNSVDLSLKLSF
ncbi:hypothetical protein JCGZ_00723 [Jatropha curcas]|uniref:Uncharacterized protein n=1 Tax=Jatropha curcas TaxID=180498 RepID=A0A067KRW5_JATCU|nr:hypothetical protein JCGZ_00723 [Jatropha curcas]